MRPGSSRGATSGEDVTIVVPLLEQNDAWLRQSLLSAVRQSRRAEVLVVTSPRTPRSNRITVEHVAAEAPHLRVIEQVRNGFPAALNQGIEAAAGLRIGLLLTDDWLDSRAVALCIGREEDIVCTQKMTWAEDGVTPVHRPWKFLTNSTYGQMPTLERKAHYLGHFFLIQKRVIEQIGGLDETLGDTPGIDDFDMIWTLLEQGATTRIVEEKLYNYRDHGGTRLTLRPREEMIATMRRIIAKHGISGSEAEEILQRHSWSFGKTAQTGIDQMRQENLTHPDEEFSD